MYAKDTRPWNEYWDTMRDELHELDNKDDYSALVQAFGDCAERVGASQHDIMRAAYALSTLYHNIYFDEPKIRQHMRKEELIKLRERKGKFKSV